MHEQSEILMPATCSEPRKTTVREVLQYKKDRLTKELSDAQAAIDALDANPEVCKVLELLARTGTRL